MPVGESEEEDAGEIGELGEEIVRNDYLLVEKPKCLSHINLSGNSKENESNKSMIVARTMNQSKISSQM